MINWYKLLITLWIFRQMGFDIFFLPHEHRAFIQQESSVIVMTIPVGECGCCCPQRTSCVSRSSCRSQMVDAHVPSPTETCSMSASTSSTCFASDPSMTFAEMSFSPSQFDSHMEAGNGGSLHLFRSHLPSVSRSDHQCVSFWPSVCCSGRM